MEAHSVSVSPRAIRFTVRGLPIAQGSARAFIAGKRAIIATGAGRGPLHAWRTAIAQEARAAAGDMPQLVGPVRVTVTFVFPRPKSHYLPANGKRPDPLLRSNAPSWMPSTPDIDKLLRSCLDALTGVLWKDDAQVVEIDGGKVYERAPHISVGAHVSVQEIGLAMHQQRTAAPAGVEGE